MKKIKMFLVVALVMFTTILFAQEAAPVQEAAKSINWSAIWDVIVKISPYIAGMFIALFGASEGLAENPNVKPNSVKQFIWGLAVKLAKKQAEKIKK